MLTEAQDEGETTAEKTLKVQDQLVKVLDKLATVLDRSRRGLLSFAEDMPVASSFLEKFGSTVLTVGGAIGGFMVGGPAGAAAGATGGNMLASGLGFAPGENYISKPTVARVGEVGTESIIRAQQIPQTVASATGMTTVLNTGDKVVRNPTGGGPTNLTINLVGKEGRVLDSTKQTISEGEMDKAISHYLNSKVSLLNS